MNKEKGKLCAYIFLNALFTVLLKKDAKSESFYNEAENVHVFS